jgi:hypothetical protein
MMEIHFHSQYSLSTWSVYTFHLQYFIYKTGGPVSLKVHHLPPRQVGVPVSHTVHVHFVCRKDRYIYFILTLPLPTGGIPVSLTIHCVVCLQDWYTYFTHNKICLVTGTQYQFHSELVQSNLKDIAHIIM